ncbi:MAG: hypothetical protein IJF49_01890, partial [Clostridia bacterium]|nr:hypothetical protein [Clostridia bacterium]
MEDLNKKTPRNHSFAAILGANRCPSKGRLPLIETNTLSVFFNFRQIKIAGKFFGRGVGEPFFRKRFPP